MARNSEGKDLPTQIYNDIKKRILSLELEPGCAFSEADVCERYNTSRTPAKSAINRLADEGYIDVTPYQTTRVALIDADKVRQFLYGRVAIEERVIRDFIKGGGLMQLEDVEHSIRKQEIVIADKPVDALTFHELDKAYHGIWYKAVDKMRIWNQLCSSIDYTRLKILDYEREQDYERIVGEHKVIASLIAKRQYDGLAAILKEHIQDHIENLMAKCIETREYFC